MSTTDPQHSEADPFLIPSTAPTSPSTSETMSLHVAITGDGLPALHPHRFHLHSQPDPALPPVLPITRQDPMARAREWDQRKVHHHPLPRRHLQAAE